MAIDPPLFDKKKTGGLEWGGGEKVIPARYF